MKLRTVLLFIAVVVTLVLTVFPEPALPYLEWLLNPVAHLVGIDLVQTPAVEPVSRLFGALCPILAGALGADVVQQLRSNRGTRLAPVAVRFPVNATGLQEPYRSIIVYRQLPSFLDQNAAYQHLAAAVVLSNHRPIFVGSFADLDERLSDPSVVGVVIDEKFRDDALVRARLGVSVYLAQSHPSAYECTRGNPSTLRLGAALADQANIYKTALALAHAHVPDVVKSAGFHGTWVTTYGLLAVREDFTGGGSGVYWYGDGIISDITITTDVDANTIDMGFAWSQSGNTYAVGSAQHGRGVFKMAAGCDVFFGYWFRRDNPNHVQLWCGTRLSNDIVSDMLNEGIYYRNFGLAQHHVSNIVDPGSA
jgi:hypothetical protein